MSNIRLLDCTLRDGGYVNDWKFGHENLISVFERLADSGVDIIEIGFLDDRRPFDTDRSIMPSTACADAIFGGLDKKNAMAVAMIDYGTCALENLSPCKESFLDGIRVIFKKHLMHEALEYCRRVKALGYKVFVQLVSVTSYNDEEMLRLIELVNDVKPYAVSMVDTYGLMHPEEMLRYYELLDKNVIPDVMIGFHGHNNFQLAYANSVAFLDKESKHDIIIDGTLFGMGKSAGNAPLELLAMRLNNKFHKHYNIDAMLEAIEETVRDFYAQAPWGYKTFFFLSGKNSCHPNYVSYFQSGQDLSASKTDELLAMITPEEKKLLYDKLKAEKLYNDYVEENIPERESLEALRSDIADRRLLLVGPGRNTRLQEKKISDFIGQYAPYVISVNYIPEGIPVDCVFVTNGKRYHDMTLNLDRAKTKVLATSNVECRNGRFDFIVKKAPLLDRSEKIMDNSFLMLIKLLLKMKIPEVFCAGFDGYSDKEDNYCDPSMEYNFVKKEAVHLNDYMRKRICEARSDMNIEFITYSAYDEVEDINGASI